MGLGHEKLDLYRLSISYVAWVFEKAKALAGIHRPARDQWLRASQSIPLNIAEGNGNNAQPPWWQRIPRQGSPSTAWQGRFGFRFRFRFGF